ncbi:MAG: hypothetical protein HC929_22770 [Leptolyngbyaceae cyanobacterium SM2_5_2]|nr:hypothetical protein [Leptolyngbyaceae cyanobacterium SM2_5_2]
MESPSKQLAQKIIDRLSQEKLLTPERGQRLVSKLTDGSLTPEDWKVDIELSQQKSEEEYHD